MADENKGADAPPVETGAEENKGGGKSPEYLERELKKVIEQRQAVKAELDKRIKEDEAKEAARLKETQKWEEAYNKEVPTLKTELETYKSKWTAFEAKLTERVTEKEGQLSKEARAEYDKFISKLPLEDREEWLISHVESIPQSSPGSVRAGAASGTQKPVKTMTAEERFAAYRANATGFAKAIT